MQSNLEILSKVKKIIALQLKKEPCDIKDNDDFVKDLGASSLDQVEIVMTMEDEFSVSISDSDAADKILSVNTATDYLINELNK